MLYILYSTLVPFNFSIEILQNNLGNIEWFSRGGKSLFTTTSFDVIANILFFIPLGIIILNTRYAFGKNSQILFNMGLAIGVGLLLSFTIEMTQLFLRERSTSLIDIIMNTTGCFLGALTAWIFTQLLNYSNRQKIVRWVQKLPPAVYLLPFLFISFIINDKTIESLLTSENIKNIYFSWEYIIKPTWIWLFLYVYIATGVLVSYSLKKYQQTSPKYLFYFFGFFLSIILLGTIEIIKTSGQIFSIPPENIAASIIGILLGISFYEIISQKNIDNRKLKKRIFVLTGFIFLLGLLILYKSLFPFKFNFSGDYLQKKLVYSLLSTHSFVPFSGFVDLCVYTIQNILLYVPLGIILNEIERDFNKKSNIGVIIIPSVILITASFILKVINDNQTPLLLEVPINVLGVFSGYFLWYGFRKEKQESS
jgi:glycopeptide antibiotics resistance protein